MKTIKRGNTGQRTVVAITLAVLACLLAPAGVIGGIITLAATGNWLNGLLFLGIAWACAFVSFIGAIGSGLFAGKSLVENSDNLAQKAEANLDKVTDRFMQ